MLLLCVQFDLSSIQLVKLLHQTNLEYAIVPMVGSGLQFFVFVLCFHVQLLHFYAFASNYPPNICFFCLSVRVSMCE